jgi:hypothetical protein
MRQYNRKRITWDRHSGTVSERQRLRIVRIRGGKINFEAPSTGAMKSLVEWEDDVAARFTNLSSVLQNSHRPKFSAENAVRTTRLLAL